MIKNLTTCWYWVAGTFEIRELEHHSKLPFKVSAGPDPIKLISASIYATLKLQPVIVVT